MRDRATIHFTLDEPAATTLEIMREQPPAASVYRRVFHLGAGAHVLRWAPRAAQPGTYVTHIDLVDSSGGHEGYDVQRLRGARVSGTPVTRVLGIDTSFTQVSAAPDSVGRLEIASDAPSLNLQFFRSGPEKSTTTRDGVLNGVAVTRPVSVRWKAHRNRPASLHVRIGHWPTGVYYARLTSQDGRVGYAPLVVRPPPFRPAPRRRRDADKHLVRVQLLGPGWRRDRRHLVRRLSEVHRQARPPLPRPRGTSPLPAV